jgi:hypothetical protein
MSHAVIRRHKREQSIFLTDKSLLHRAKVALQFRELVATKDLSNSVTDEYTELHLRLVRTCLLNFHCYGHNKHTGQNVELELFCQQCSRDRIATYVESSRWHCQ